MCNVSILTLLLLSVLELIHRCVWLRLIDPFERQGKRLRRSITSVWRAMHCSAVHHSSDRHTDGCLPTATAAGGVAASDEQRRGTVAWAVARPAPWAALLLLVVARRMPKEIRMSIETR